MAWLFFFLIVHLMFGLFCAYLAYETKLKAEPWFVAGTILGGLGLLFCWLIVNQKKVNRHLNVWFARLT